MGNGGGHVQGEEDADAGPDAGGLGRGVVTEGFQEGEDDEDGRPTVVEQEGEVDEDFVGGALGLVELLHDVVDMLWRGR